MLMAIVGLTLGVIIAFSAVMMWIKLIISFDIEDMLLAVILFSSASILTSASTTLLVQNTIRLHQHLSMLW